MGSGGRGPVDGYLAAGAAGAAGGGRRSPSTAALSLHPLILRSQGDTLHPLTLCYTNTSTVHLLRDDVGVVSPTTGPDTATRGRGRMQLTSVASSTLETLVCGYNM